jgi:hypothetical protein
MNPNDRRSSRRKRSLSMRSCNDFALSATGHHPNGGRRGVIASEAKQSSCAPAGALKNAG